MTDISRKKGEGLKRRQRLNIALVFGLMATSAVAGCGTLSSPSPSNQSSAGGFTTSAPVNSAPLNWPVPAFHGVDEQGKSFRSSQLKGKVWLMDIFYSTCPTVCPPIASNMAHLQRQLASEGIPIQFISLSVDPQHETPAILKRFGAQRGANFTNWHMLTGYSYPWIQQFSIHTLKEPLTQTPNTQLYSHTVSWYLVNQSGDIVSLFNGLTPPYDQIVQAVKALG